MTAGERVRSWRRLRGLSYRGLASTSGLRASALHRIEHGHQEPRADEIEKIAAALGLSMPEFYGATPAKPGRSANG